MTVVFSENEHAPEYVADPEVFDDLREDREDIRRNVESAHESAKSNADDDRDFEESAAFREELEQLFPGHKASHMGGLFADLEARVEADPINGGTQVRDWVAQNLSRFGDGAKPSTDSGYYATVNLPNGKTVKPVAGSLGHEIAAAMAKTANEKEQRDALRELQQRLRQRGRSLTEHFKLARDFAAEARKNPAFAASKLAAMKGLPLSDQAAEDHAAMQRARASAEQELRAMVNDTANYPRLMELRGLMAAEVKQGASLHDAYHVAAKVADDLAAFKSKHSDWEAHKPAMSALLESGKAKDLEDAYRQAKAKPKGNDLRAELRTQLRARR